MSVDGRRAERRKMLKRVMIFFNEGHSSTEGVLKNISDTGGFVEFRDGILVPDQFTLSNELDGYMVECEMMRRQGQGGGFRFISDVKRFAPKKTQVINMIDHYETPAAEPANESKTNKEFASEFARRRQNRPAQAGFGKRSL